MKIWCQSSSSIGSEFRLKPYEESLQKHIQKIIRPGTSVDLHGVKVWRPGASWLRYAEHLNSSQILENALEAERKGYDAFVVLCMNDPVFYELRQILNIPVVSAGETAFHVACLLAPKFTILGYDVLLLMRQTENAKRYGIGERLVSVGAFNITQSDIMQSFTNATPVLNSIIEVSKKASDAGSTMLVPNCGILNMILVNNDIREAGNIPILDAIGAAVKMAELLIDLKALGVSRSSLGLYTRVTAGELSALRKTYGLNKA